MYYYFCTVSHLFLQKQLQGKTIFFNLLTIRLLELISQSEPSASLANNLKSADVQFVSCTAYLCSALIPAAVKDLKKLISELKDERTLKYIRKLLSSKISKTGNLSSVTGSTFGYQHFGLFDGAVMMIDKLLQTVANL